MVEIQERRIVSYEGDLQELVGANDLFVRHSNANDCVFFCDNCVFSVRYDFLVSNLGPIVFFDMRCPNCRGRMHLWRPDVLYVNRKVNKDFHFNKL